jgi:hypothetical protein
VGLLLHSTPVACIVAVTAVAATADACHYACAVEQDVHAKHTVAAHAVACEAAVCM